MKFNEDTRVKLPTVIHLVKLGYIYISKKKHAWDEDTNIFTDIFFENIKRLNPEINHEDIKKIYSEISTSLSNEDLGKEFYEKIISKSGIKLIDFEDFKNNALNVVTELTYKKDDEEFRPDITVLVNGMPLIFIEVKKPNNKDGILAEQKRIQKRFKNKKFKKFINITQIILFSNNMEYDDSSHLPIEGAFYSTTSYENTVFNYFREEHHFDLNTILSSISDEDENYILKDNNLVSIKEQPEYITNKNPDNPTNRICTSMLSPERISFFLRYGLVYLKNKKGIQKHVMRYPQFFASKAIVKELEKKISKGVIWHTQGSGKTALVYFSLKYLLNYFQSKKIISKYYFIVDRIDLLKQANKEFRSRGLVVHNISSREEFVKDIKSKKAIHNNLGKDEITVVNIQKFKDDTNIFTNDDYDIDIQKVYFLDEVHRSYNPKGSFLANLHGSDNNAIKIGLTGTPLLGKEINTRGLFGNYIHKYFYNSSIADGYTLRLIREEIENQYKSKLEKTLNEIKVLKGSVERKLLYSDKRFVEPMLDYILQDFEKSRIMFNDNSIGGMVVCDSYEQAQEMFKSFNEKLSKKELESSGLKNENKTKSAGLILYDEGTKDDRDEIIDEFKEGKIDLLFVYNMLLTGFDSPRLKKIYLGRKIKSHNLLQALTRVNRTYNDFRYGYVVDFADIQKEFDKTNKAYFDELELELGDEIKNYKDMFKNSSEIENELNEIKKILFKYDTSNGEIFSQQINQINNKNEIQEIVKSLTNVKELYNIARLTGKTEIIEKIDFNNINKLLILSKSRLTLINTKETLENRVDVSGLLNLALEDLVFAFKKVKEEELVLTDTYRNILKKTRESLGNNLDPKDQIFINLRDELERLFKKKDLTEVSSDDLEKNIPILEKIYENSQELNRKNQLLKAKYDYDEKYVRIHKRLLEKDPLTKNETKLFEALKSLKKETDEHLLKNSNILNNESYVDKMISSLIISELKNKHDIDLDLDKTKMINQLMKKEYMNEYMGNVA